MRFAFQVLLSVLCVMTPIRAAFEDFVIENEKDLQRFGVSNDETMHYEYDVLNEDDDCIYNADNAIDSKCLDYGDFSGSYNIFQRICGNDIDAADGSSAFDGNIDENVLKEILRQLVNDRSLYPLKNHFREAEDVLNQDYADYYLENMDSRTYYE